MLRYSMGQTSKAKLTISRSLLLDIHQDLVLSKLRIVRNAAFDHFDRTLTRNVIQRQEPSFCRT